MVVMGRLHIGIVVLNAPILVGIVVRRLLALALDEAADGAATDGSTAAMLTMMMIRMQLMVMGLVLVVVRHG